VRFPFRIKKPQLRVVAKYFLHGILFALVSEALLFLWVFVLLALAFVGLFIGFIIGVILLFLFFGYANALITNRIWHVRVKTDWKSALLDGLLLFVSLTLVQVPSFVTNYVFPSLSSIIVLFLVYCFVDGFVARRVADRWAEIREEKESVTAYRKQPQEAVFLGWVFLVPALLLLTIFVLYPIANTIYMSFISKQGAFVGLQNYDYVLFQKVNPLINLPNLAHFRFPVGALVDNVLWIAIHLPLTIFFGLMFAVLLREVRGGFIVKTIVFLGVVIPMVIGGVLFRFIFDKDAGVANFFLTLIGLGQHTETWYAFSNTALFSLILGSIWIWTGFVMVVYSAGLEGIPRDVYEASKIDGASRWTTFWRVTVPLLKPTTLVIITLTVLWELKVFDIVYVATFGGPGGSSTVMAFDMYLQAFYASDYSAASAIAVLLTLITFGVAAYVVSRMAKSG
jgi:multiple sugar transport system permease protein